MSLLELFVIAVGLSMDAFAVAICKGLALPKINLKNAALVGLYFGFFQMIMPLIGYLVGSRFADSITAIDHWIAFALLTIIGAKMIYEAVSGGDEDAGASASLNFRTMIVLAIATSIDALAVGVTFAFLNVDIIPAVSFIGVVTFILSALGVKIGNIFGLKYKSRAELAGGIILIIIGVKILLEHLGVIG